VRFGAVIALRVDPAVKEHWRRQATDAGIDLSTLLRARLDHPNGVEHDLNGGRR
jgi:antitoxin component of RelBE/YafQ-DinJ toxin-antitoxin module